MKSVDLVIIGGGMVGLALAALLRNTDCRIKIIEKSPPPDIEDNAFANRVSAVNAAGEAMLRRVGALQQIPVERISAYDQMFVWEKDSFANIHFDNRDPVIRQLGLPHLGLILENRRIQAALWHQVSRQANAEIIAAAPQTVGIGENGAFLTLDNGEMLSAKLVVGADGANSWLRNHTDIPLNSRDYEHTALVCNVQVAESHERTARQIFAPDGILAFLPLPDEHLCSIVWSLPPEKARILLTCDEKSFNQALTVAFDNRLGLVELRSERATYPLTARYARDFAQNRLALIGDAAHTIHPLAGLGVNLGFADAVCLAQTIERHSAAGNDIGEYRHLRRFERTRKAEAVKLLATMEGLKQLFHGDHPIKKLVRGLGLSAANQLPLLKKQLIAQATGI